MPDGHHADADGHAAGAQPDKFCPHDGMRIAGKTIFKGDLKGLQTELNVSNNECILLIEPGFGSKTRGRCVQALTNACG